MLPSTAVTLHPLGNDYDPSALPPTLVFVQKPGNRTAYIDREGSTNPKNYCIIYRLAFGLHSADTSTSTYTFFDYYGMTVTAKISVTIKAGPGIAIDSTKSKAHRARRC